MEIRFVSSNNHKISEVKNILDSAGVIIVPSSLKIEEIQTEDVHKLVRDKVLKAFYKIGKPVFIEHTGLYIESFNNLPGGLTQIFWDNLEAARFCELFGSLKNTYVTAKTIIGYCDGRKLHYFEGVIDGNVSSEPSGPRDFQWDCVFVPNGFDITFADMGYKKHDISMRKKALDSFCEYLSRETK
jgi:XTP/dITP diphosphohydrolase